MAKEKLLCWTIQTRINNLMKSRSQDEKALCIIGKTSTICKEAPHFFQPYSATILWWHNPKIMIPILIRLNNTTFVALCHQYDYTKSPYYGSSSYEDRNDGGYLNLFLYYTDKRLQNYARRMHTQQKYNSVHDLLTYTEFTGDKLFTKQSFRYRGIFFVRIMV